MLWLEDEMSPTTHVLNVCASASKTVLEGYITLRRWGPDVGVTAAFGGLSGPFSSLLSA